MVMHNINSHHVEIYPISTNLYGKNRLLSSIFFCLVPVHHLESPLWPASPGTESAALASESASPPQVQGSLVSNQPPLPPDNPQIELQCETKVSGSKGSKCLGTWKIGIVRRLGEARPGKLRGSNTPNLA